MHCWIEQPVPCGSTRSSAWADDWLLLGTDEGSLKAARVPSASLYPTTRTSDPSQEKEDEKEHSQCHSGHVGPVCCVCADAHRGWVATGDSDGNISTWQETNHQWQRRAFFCLWGPGALVGLLWVNSGGPLPHLSLCALHEDGRLVCGTPEGQRLWSRDVRKPCSCFCASPSGANFVLATPDGDILLYDSRGIYMRKLALKGETSQGQRVTTLAWQPGSWAVRPLLVAYSTGHALLLQTEGDVQGLSVDTGLSLCVAAEWNPSGTLIALLGLPGFGVPSLTSSSTGTSKALTANLNHHDAAPVTLILLVRASGEAIASLDLARADPRTLAWSRCGERLAATTEQDLFLLSFRHDFVCCAYGENAIAAAGPFIPQQLATEVCFTRMREGYRCSRVFRGPRLLVAGDARCAIVPHAIAALPADFAWKDERSAAVQKHLEHQEGPYLLPDEGSVCDFPSGFQQQQQKPNSDGFPIELCDASGSTVETMVCPVGPRHAVLISDWLVVADGAHHLWLGPLASEIDGPASLVDLDNLGGDASCERLKGDITALGGHSHCIVVVRKTGQFLRLKLSPSKPYAQLEAACFVPRGLQNLKLNVETTVVAGRDQEGRLHILMATPTRRHRGPPFSFGEELCDPLDDILDYVWASDHTDLLAVMQRTGMRLIHTGNQEVEVSCRMEFKGSTEPTIRGPLYLIEFAGLCAKALSPNSLLQGPADASGQSLMVSYDAEPLTQMRRLVEVRPKGSDDPGALAGLHEAAALASRFCHPILWRLLADAALASEELDVTEEALVRCEDYCGLQVLKRARQLGAGADGRPLIAALAGDILGAGAYYEVQQRREQAAELFASFGMWNAASDILRLTEAEEQSRHGVGMERVREALAEAWKERGNWRVAIEFYQYLGPSRELLEAYFYSERYEDLESLACELPEGDTQLWLRAAELLGAAGRGLAAAEAYLKAGKPTLAVDAALQGGEWAKAFALARQHCSSKKVQAVTAAYKAAMHHQDKGGSCCDTAQALLALGASEAAAQELGTACDLNDFTRNPHQQRKKMRVMAALLLRQSQMRDERRTKRPLEPSFAGCTSSTSRGKLLSSVPGLTCEYLCSAEEEEHWLSADAHHLYLLCCFHLSEQRVRAALCSAVRLWECYPKELTLSVKAHVLFVSACKAREWDLCSQALHTLEMNPQISPGEKQQLEKTGLLLFAKRHAFAVPNAREELCCPRCNALSSYWECFCPSCDLPFPWCAATGLPIRYITCLLQRGSNKRKPQRASAPLAAADERSSTCNERHAQGDLDSVWPYGGASLPEECTVCGHLTAAWGPGGPLFSCPLCSQPFSASPAADMQFQNGGLVWPPDEGAACSVCKISPDDILLQASELGEPRTTVSQAVAR